MSRIDQGEFHPVGETEFIFLARASLGHSPRPDAEAEQERLRWISDDLRRNAMCPHGWLLIERAPLRAGREALLGYPDHKIMYRGRCAPAAVPATPPTQS